MTENNGLSGPLWQVCELGRFCHPETGLFSQTTGADF